jgi:hypothetical protein
MAAVEGVLDDLRIRWQRLQCVRACITGHATDQLHSVHSKLQRLEAQYAELNKAMHVERLQLQLAKNLLHSVQLQSAELDALAKVIPQAQPEPAVPSKQKTAKSVPRKLPKPTPVVLPSISTPVPAEKEPQQNDDVGGIPQIRLFEAKELDEIPIHTKGRLTLEKVNRAISDLNEILSKKYTFLAGPMNLEEDSKRIARYSADYAVDLTVPGAHKTLQKKAFAPKLEFFSEQDVREDGKCIRMDNTGKTILNLLRLTSRVKRQEGLKSTVYVIM